jgi:L-alanine-DL-glutamate epimerase-like enolase superfamily enzyme
VNETIERVEVAAYRMPLRERESDGTYCWDHVSLVVVQVRAAGLCGLGYSYASPAAAPLIRTALAEVVVGGDAMAVSSAWRRMLERVRNLGRPGVAAYAIAAVDAALWDLKAKLLGCPLARLLGQVRDEVPIYASGGFTSLSDDALAEQLGGWAEQGIPRVKMKVGRAPERDVVRVALARRAIGPGTELFVDANGGYSRKQALGLAVRFAEQGVCWFEEPRPSHDLDGLRLIRDRGPAGMDITGGEYGCDAWTFRRMLDAGAVDVLQADATRAMGVTGLLRIDALCHAYEIPLSLHTAPALHLHLGAALDSVVHLEWFHDHVWIERVLFEGAREPEPGTGVMRIDPSALGHGLTLREGEASRYAL